MAKAPVIKFPRIEAGFYTVTRDGALMGYISKKVEGKETSWMVFNTKDPEYGTMGVESLPVTAMVEETELFREAKDYAREFFSNMEVVMEEEENEEDAPEMEIETLELQEPEWTEEDQSAMMTEADLFDEISSFEDTVDEEELAIA